ncbi:sensor domain-containing diguanylate cyclase [Marinobacter oulmenensis]|uniref:Diguanylate cyclase (GGDEF)-like protein/PAS domain S-box-containing protein n=1 Tax=Marinobacter oulmenensis TaxID=643747 RepID=A0A840UA58_9GAMM|nr:sensor domain-containing diguanylate cyclase [Marinobacter oulmenensis]MBB5322624.1 diguanylate cyclase (GGDEF)-like protein/PAS domain S-box-containing protein [Marinobacter oulmenensis]
MDIFEQKRRITTIAIVAVVMTGVTIAAIVAIPLINTLHNNAVESAASVARAKARNLHTLFDQHQDLARQTASRSELAAAMADYAQGKMSLTALKTFSEPRLSDAIAPLDNLAALIRYDREGHEVIRLGPLAGVLPENIQPSIRLDIRNFPLAETPDADTPLMLASSPITRNERVVGRDLLLFSLTPLKGVFLNENETGIGVCLMKRDMSRRVALNETTGKMEITPPELCLAMREGVDKPEELEHFHARLDDGTDVLSFVNRVDGYDWQLHMHQTVDAIFGGVERQIMLSAAAILALSAVGGLGVWLSIGPVTTALVRQTAEIARSTEELRLAHQVFVHTHEAMIVANADLQIIRANPAFTEITGIDLKDLENRSISEFLDAGRRKHPLPEQLKQRLIAENAWQGEVWLKTLNGQSRPYLLTMSPVRNERGQIQQLVLAFSDISERIRAEAQMLRQANHDPLTGLPNRMALNLHLKQAIEQARRDHGQFAVIYLDLDRFKPVNDTLGHQAGDELLQHVARRLEHCIRREDIVGRRGGDEFLIVSGPLDRPEDVELIAEKTVIVLNQPFRVQGQDVQIGVSVGVALFPDDGQTAEELLNRADMAMYQVKGSGRNNVAYA